MKAMKRCFLVITMMIAMHTYGQITINACHPFFDNQDFVLMNTETDLSGRHVFETNPIDGDQPCSGIGVCELKIQWNDSESRWELIADDGNGDFNTSFVMYYNEEASSPNPPSLLLGTWVENTTVTINTCGGDGEASINTLIGELQDTTLSLDVMLLRALELSPNPSYGLVSVRGLNNYNVHIRVFDINGQVLREQEPLLNDQFDISELSQGVYFVQLLLNGQSLFKKLIKN